MAFVPFVESDQPTMANFNDKIGSAYDRIILGSYVGTGTFGEENPNSIIFPRKIQAIIIYGYRTSDTNTVNFPYTAHLFSPGYIPETQGSITVFMPGGNMNINSAQYITFDGYKLSWYNTLNQYQQGNASGFTYYYMAIAE